MRIAGIILILLGIAGIGYFLYRFKGAAENKETAEQIKRNNIIDRAVLVISPMIIILGIFMMMNEGKPAESKKPIKTTEPTITTQEIESLPTVAVQVDDEGGTTYIAVETDENGSENFIELDETTTVIIKDEETTEDMDLEGTSEEKTTVVKEDDTTKEEETTTSKEEEVTTTKADDVAETTTKEIVTTAKPTTTKAEETTEQETTTTKPAHESGEIKALSESLYEYFAQWNTNQTWQLVYDEEWNIIDCNSRGVMHESHLEYLTIESEKWFAGNYTTEQYIEKMYKCPWVDKYPDRKGNHSHWDHGVGDAEAHILTYDGYRDDLTHQTVFEDLWFKCNSSDVTLDFLYVKAYYNSDTNKTYVYYAAANIGSLHPDSYWN